jgi:hypothetical protein
MSWRVARSGRPPHDLRSCFTRAGSPATVLLSGRRRRCRSVRPGRPRHLCHVSSGNVRVRTSLRCLVRGCLAIVALLRRVRPSPRGCLPAFLWSTNRAPRSVAAIRWLRLVDAAGLVLVRSELLSCLPYRYDELEVELHRVGLRTEMSTFNLRPRITWWWRARYRQRAHGRTRITAR